jgi:hypothetical protein
LAVAGAVMVAVSAAWPLAVSLSPGAKPYIGGSTDGSVWNLIFGYNGFGRLTGSEGGMGGPGFGGAAGLWRMFNTQVGGQIKGELKYVLVSSDGGRCGSQAISDWVTRHGTEVAGMSGLYKVAV